MANGLILTTNGKKIILNRTFKETPDYKAPTQFKVGTGTATPVIGDTDLGTPVDITAGVQVKDFASGYPSLNETTLQSTIRGVLLTTEANGNSLTEFGTFNEDASPLMFNRIVHTAISKTSSVQVIYVAKDKIGVG